MFLQATESPTSVGKNELFALLDTIENFCPRAVVAVNPVVDEFRIIFTTPCPLLAPTPAKSVPPNRDVPSS